MSLSQNLIDRCLIPWTLRNLSLGALAQRAEQFHTLLRSKRKDKAGASATGRRSPVGLHRNAMMEVFSQIKSTTEKRCKDVGDICIYIHTWHEVTVLLKNCKDLTSTMWRLRPRLIGIKPEFGLQLLPPGIFRDATTKSPTDVFKFQQREYWALALGEVSVKCQFLS